MGWTFPYDQPHRSDLIKERVEKKEWANKDGSTVKSIALKHCYKGGMRSGVLYIVWEQTITPKDGKPESKRFIEVDLLQYHRSNQYGSSWGYKDMDCCCGPCQLSCPVSYLDLCPPHDAEYCKGWHQKVRAHVAEKNAARAKLKGLKPGDTVKLVAGCKAASVKLITLRPLIGTDGYTRYKLRPDLIDWPIPATV